MAHRWVPGRRLTPIYGALRAEGDSMLKVIVWLGASYVSAFVVLGAAVAMLSLKTEKTERLLDQEVRR